MSDFFKTWTNRSAIAIASGILLASCVSKQKLLDSEAALRYCKNDSTRLAQNIIGLNAQIDGLNGQVKSLNQKISDLNNENNQLAQDANMTQSQLEKSNRDFLAQQKKAEQLQQLLDAQKQKANALREKMADALGSFKSSELTVTQKNGKVYVSLQESLLFASGKADVNPKGITALSKLAEVLNQNPDITVNIEGHTDTVPILGGKFKDNWGLSTERALSIVRILVKDYQVRPESVIAAGHSQYDPVDTNETAEGRAKNRRTEIILSPKLDELYKLLEN